MSAASWLTALKSASWPPSIRWYLKRTTIRNQDSTTASSWFHSNPAPRRPSSLTRCTTCLFQKPSKKFLSHWKRWSIKTYRRFFYPHPYRKNKPLHIFATWIPKKQTTSRRRENFSPSLKTRDRPCPAANLTQRTKARKSPPTAPVWKAPRRSTQKAVLKRPGASKPPALTMLRSSANLFTLQIFVKQWI